MTNTMTNTGGQMANVWSLVLAAGEGSRLHSLTTCRDGRIPKQFCSLRGGRSLLHEALARAGVASAPQHVCVVVAEQHRRWWDLPLRHLPPSNVLVQPCNRGTGYGILLPLLHILERDPAARLVIFPSDHHVQQEAVLSGALRRALHQRLRGSDETILLGLEPRESDPELGYIIPGNAEDQDIFRVRQFVEKPPQSVAHELIAHGALWNSFILATTGRALLSLYERCAPELVSRMRTAMRADRATAGSVGRVTELYAPLAQLDFSRDILEGQERHLRVLRVAHCGWNDLGTPRRVAEALRGSRREQPGASQELSAVMRDEMLRESPPSPPFARGYLNLAAQFEALQARPG